MLFFSYGLSFPHAFFHRFLQIKSGFMIKEHVMILVDHNI